MLEIAEFRILKQRFDKAFGFACGALQFGDLRGGLVDMLVQNGLVLLELLVDRLRARHAHHQLDDGDRGAQGHRALAELEDLHEL